MIAGCSDHIRFAFSCPATSGKNEGGGEICGLEHISVQSGTENQEKKQLSFYIVKT